MFLSLRDLFLKPAFAACLMATLVMSPAAVRAAEIQGVTFEKEQTVNGQRLTLRGVSLLRHLVVIKAYVGAFYLLEGEPSASALADAERRLVLHYFQKIPAKGFADATAAMIEENLPPEEYSRMAERVQQMNSLYRDVTPGDRYIATYVPATGTQLTLNGQLLGTVPGADFSRAFFSIWIGENPIDKNFRDDLLSGAGLQP